MYMEPQLPPVQATPPAQTPPNGGAAAVPAPMPNAAAPATPVAPTQPAPAAPIAPTADDSDVIEPTWVNRAQAVFKNYPGDPSEQSKQFMLLKAEYLEKRYGRTIKAED